MPDVRFVEIKVPAVVIHRDPHQRHRVVVRRGDVVHGDLHGEVHEGEELHHVAKHRVPALMRASGREAPALVEHDVGVHVSLQPVRIARAIASNASRANWAFGCSATPSPSRPASHRVACFAEPSGDVHYLLDYT